MIIMGKRIKRRRVRNLLRTGGLLMHIVRVDFFGLRGWV
jgi:hypothetical protein